MKKKEAAEIAIQKSQLIIEYITQILSDERKVNASMKFLLAEVNHQSMFILDIYVPEVGFSKQIDLEIPIVHKLVLYERLLNDLLDTFIEHETMVVGRYYSMKSMRSNFTGIDAFNASGSQIKINFSSSGTDFQDVISRYEERYHELAEQVYKKQAQKVKRR